MDISLASYLGRDLLLTALLLVAPAIAASLIVGLVVSILQTITSIQEQTMTFAPRIVAVTIVIALMLPWSLQVVTSFTQRMMHYAVLEHLQ